MSTAPKADEAAGADSTRRQLELALERVTDGFVTFDRDWRCTYANDAAARIVGRPKEEMIGKVLWDEEPGSRATPFYAEAAAALADGRPRSIELYLPTQGRWFIDYLYPSADGVTLIFNDITDRKRAEEALSQAKAAAEAANVAKSQFLANMSHELRTPLNAILRMTELALEEPLSPRLRDMLETARDASDDLLELLDGILDLSRIEAGRHQLERADFSLRRALDQALTPLALRASQRGLELRLEVAVDVPDELTGDPMRLRQVLVNLAGNAIKFTHQGEIVVRVASIERRDREAVLEFSVSDTGIGISRDDQERIFAPFTQVDASTSRRYGGAGLGLAISRRLVELMGGALRVESEPGVGSTFRFTAPLGLAAATEPAEAGRPLGTWAPPPAARPLRVLVVEDTPASQKLAAYVLGKRGHVAEVASDGRQALERVQAGRFDAVLMDVQMPEMDGFEATAAIRALGDPRKARVPIIAMTAHALKGDAERCLEAGMDAYLSKPIDGQEMIRVVERLGGGRGPDGGSPVAERAALAAPCGRAKTCDERDLQPAFDRAAAVRTCFGQEGLFRQMITSLFDEAGPLLEQMRAALARADAAALAAAAHRLKNTVVYLAAPPATAATQRLVDLGRAGDLAEAAPAIAELEDRLAELVEALANSTPRPEPR